jgi:hypothetical protein
MSFVRYLSILTGTGIVYYACKSLFQNTRNSEAKSSSNNVHIFETEDDLSKSAAQFISKCSDEAIKAHGSFLLALSGGSLPKLISSGLLDQSIRSHIDFSRWHVCWYEYVQSFSSGKNDKSVVIELH